MLEGDSDKLLKMESASASASSAKTRPSTPSAAPSAADASACAIPRKPIGSFLFLGPLRRGQDRARQGAGRVPLRRRAGHDAPRHERVHGAPHGPAAPRRAPRATSTRSRAASSPRPCAGAPTACSSSTRSRRPTATSSTCCSRCSTTAASPTAAGASADFSNTVVIMTSNIGSRAHPRHGPAHVRVRGRPRRPRRRADERAQGEIFALSSSTASTMSSSSARSAQGRPPRHRRHPARAPREAARGSRAQARAAPRREDAPRRPRAERTARPPRRRSPRSCSRGPGVSLASCWAGSLAISTRASARRAPRRAPAGCRSWGPPGRPCGGRRSWSRATSTTRPSSRRRPSSGTTAPRSRSSPRLEHDHIDIYPTAQSYLAAFEGFVERLPEHGLVVARERCARGRGGARAAPAARSRGSRSRAKTPTDSRPTGWPRPSPPTREGQSFDLYVGGVVARRAATRLWGRHNVRNAAAALAAVCQGFGVPVDAGPLCARRVRGVRRRQDLRFEVGGVRVYDDFAHHPTAVARPCGAARGAPRGRALRRCSSRAARPPAARCTRRDYEGAFAAADEVILAPSGAPDIPESRAPRPATRSPSSRTAPSGASTRSSPTRSVLAAHDRA
jgi:hypothetical protein